MTKYFRLNRRMSLAGIAAIVLFSSPVLQAAAGEDEWYDPSDWFDGNNIESDDNYSGEYGYYDYNYPYTYDWDSWNTYSYWNPGTYSDTYWDNTDWYDTTDNMENNTSNTSTSASSTSSSSSSSADNNTDRVRTYVVFVGPVSTAGSATASTSSSSSQSGQSQAARGFNRLSGTVQGVNEVDLKRQSGATGTYTVALVKLEDGKETVVNLGRSSQLDNVSLSKGDEIRAIGSRGRVDGQDVFVAHSIEVEGKTIDANPAIRLRTTASSNQAGANRSGTPTSPDMQSGQSQRTIQGKVAGFSHSSDAGKANHTVLNLQLENGKSEKVDLGPAASPQKIGLDVGDRVTIKGHVTKRSGKDVLVADLMKIDGEKVSQVGR